MFQDKLVHRFPKLAAKILGEEPNVPIKDIYTCATLKKSKIPNNVYQTWQVPYLGKTHTAILREFREKNLDFSFHFFDQNAMDQYMETIYAGQPILKIYQNAYFGPIKTDIWRYCILYERGGVYFDINKLVRLPLRELINPTDAAVISFERNLLPSDIAASRSPILNYPNNRIINWGLAFEKNHPILKTLLENIVNAYPALKGQKVPNVKEAVIRFTGPCMLTQTIHELIEKGEKIIFTQAGIDFHGSGDFNIKGSWSRYAYLKSYAKHFNTVIAA